MAYNLDLCCGANGLFIQMGLNAVLGYLKNGNKMHEFPLPRVKPYYNDFNYVPVITKILSENCKADEIVAVDFEALQKHAQEILDKLFKQGLDVNKFTTI